MLTRDFARAARSLPTTTQAASPSGEKAYPVGSHRTAWPLLVSLQENEAWVIARVTLTLDF